MLERRHQLHLRDAPLRLAGRRALVDVRVRRRTGADREVQAVGRLGRPLAHRGLAGMQRPGGADVLAELAAADHRLAQRPVVVDLEEDALRLPRDVELQRPEIDRALALLDAGDQLHVLPDAVLDHPVVGVDEVRAGLVGEGGEPGGRVVLSLGADEHLLQRVGLAVVAGRVRAGGVLGCLRRRRLLRGGELGVLLGRALRLAADVEDRDRRIRLAREETGHRRVARAALQREHRLRGRRRGRLRLLLVLIRRRRDGSPGSGRHRIERRRNRSSSQDAVSRSRSAATSSSPNPCERSHSSGEPCRSSSSSSSRSIVCACGM